MGRTRIVLSGLGSILAGLTWESDRVLRIGRRNNLDVVLRDYSVDPMHAEVRFSGGRWLLRDQAKSPLHITVVNREPVHGDRPLAPQDVIQLGKVMLRVAELETGETPGPTAAGSSDTAVSPAGDCQIRASGLHMRVQAATARSWNEAIESVARDQLADTPLPESIPARPVHSGLQIPQGVLTLLRANHHLMRIADLDKLLQSILADMVNTTSAQRGAIILADPVTGELTLRALLAPGLPPLANGRPYSRTLIDRCFRLGESLLCRDARADQDLLQARSVRVGTMNSIICALLRSPRQRLGVLHLDRGPLQDAFTENDLYLTDAIAASVAVGIESAQLIEQQRQQFIDTVQTLARAVEMRDQYTGDHTRRVTDYSLLLAEQLHLSAGDKYQLQIGTPLHDIGKIGIDDAILRKPGKLTVSEFEAMKTHTTKGASMVTSLINLVPMIPIIKHHHERFDGQGYPEGLRGEQIPMIARIVAVADAFDAMTSDRPYRRALSLERAFGELAHTSGTHFDPRCVEAFLRARVRVEDLLRGA
jgi:HD domain/GAF domain/Inner membrane component of T3SS, cytoplasmic domain